jgi:tetratricopeptide (TPR) repeat protein
LEWKTAFFLILGVSLIGIAFLVPRGTNALLTEALPKIHAGWVALVLAAAAFLRFYKLTSLFSWPIVDEGVFGYFALRQTQHWDWTLLHSPSQEPALYSWLLAGTFKLLGTSLFALWLFPALCSLLFVVLTWLACRRYLSNSAAFIVLTLTASCFWVLYTGRYSVQSILMLVWEGLTFWALAGFLLNPTRRLFRLTVLSILAGTGLYIYLAWPLVIVMVFLTLATTGYSRLGERLRSLALFSLVVVITALPLALAFLNENRGYFSHLWSFTSQHSGAEHLHILWDYFAAIFWGIPANSFFHGPVWGGLLNPVSGSLFLMGMVVLLRSRVNPLGIWCLLAFFLFFTPAFMTDNIEIMRLITLLPILILGSVAGLQFLLGAFTARRKVLFFLVLIFSSLLLDGIHLFQRYPQKWFQDPAYFGAHKSPEFFRSFSLLEDAAKRNGPGLIFLNFDPDPFDQTLRIATYEFNAGENPGLESSKAKWAGILGNIHEEPYLNKLFPNGRWGWLSVGLDRRDGGVLLDIVPIDDSNRDLFTRWLKADQALAELTDQVMELGVDPDQRAMLGVLDKGYPLFHGDPLLESRFWRIRAIHLCAKNEYGQAIEDEQKAVQKGHPMAHLFNEMGCMLYKQGRWGEARKAFQMALKSKPNASDASKNLEVLILDTKKTEPK